jgi:hypothetical protein
VGNHDFGGNNYHNYHGVLAQILGQHLDPNLQKQVQAQLDAHANSMLLQGLESAGRNTEIPANTLDRQGQITEDDFVVGCTSNALVLARPNAEQQGYSDRNSSRNNNDNNMNNDSDINNKTSINTDQITAGNKLSFPQTSAHSDHSATVATRANDSHILTSAVRDAAAAAGGERDRRSGSVTSGGSLNVVMEEGAPRDDVYERDHGGAYTCRMYVYVCVCVCFECGHGRGRSM